MSQTDLVEVFADDFNRANNAAIGNSWLEFGGDPGGPWEINGNRLMRRASPNGAAMDTAYRAVKVVDCYVECVPIDDLGGPVVRTTGTGDGYHAYWSTASGRVFLEKSGGSALGQSSVISWTLGTDILRLEVRDTLVTVYKNGSLIIEEPDTAHLWGWRGVRAREATGDVRIDNFAMGE